MDTNSNVPEKYYRDDYDPYSEAALILKEPAALENTLRTLSQYDKLIENKLKSNIEQDHTEVTDFLSNVRDCEELLEDQLTAISDTRTNLARCKELLRLKKRDVQSIWYKSIYYTTVLNELEKIEELLSMADTINVLCRDKLFSQATNVIKETLTKLRDSEYVFIPIMVSLEEIVQQKTSLLAKSISYELREQLYLRQIGMEKEYRRYAIQGTLNIVYLLNTDNVLEDNQNSNIERLLDGISSINYITKLPELIYKDIKSDMETLLKSAISCAPDEAADLSESPNQYCISSIMPKAKTIESVHKIINGVVALCTIVIRNHLYLTKLLQTKYKYEKLNLETLWRAIDLELKLLASSFLKMTTVNPVSSSSYTLFTTEMSSAETAYSSMLSNLIQVSPFLLPYIYKFISGYYRSLYIELEARGVRIQTEAMIEELDIHAKHFLLLMGKEALIMQQSQHYSYEAFRFRKNEECRFPALSTVIHNIEELLNFRKLLPKVFHPHILYIISEISDLFAKEISAKYENYARGSGFAAIMLDDPNVYQALRLSPEFRQARCTNDFEGTTQLMNIIEPSGSYVPGMKSLVESREVGFLTFQLTVDRALLLENSKVNFLSAIVTNLQDLYDELIIAVHELTSEIPPEALVPQPIEESKVSEVVAAKTPPKTSKMFNKFKKSIQRGLQSRKKLDLTAMEDESPDRSDSKSSFSITASTLQDSVSTIRKIIEQCQDIQSLHDKTVLLIHGEMRMRVFHFLHYIKDNNYWREDELMDSEWFIGQLSRELMQAYLSMKNILNDKKLYYIWHDVFDLINDMFITGVGIVKGAAFSRQGLAVYTKNIRVLQNELSQFDLPNIPTRQVLKRAQEYVDLLNINEKSLVQYIKEKYSQFNITQWETQMGLRTPSRPKGVSQEARRTVRELLRTLPVQT